MTFIDARWQIEAARTNTRKCGNQSAYQSLLNRRLDGPASGSAQSLHPILPRSCDRDCYGNFLRTLATPEPNKDWSMTPLKDKLIKIGAKVVGHGRYIIFEILRLIAALRPQPPPALA